MRLAGPCDRRCKPAAAPRPVECATRFKPSGVVEAGGIGLAAGDALERHRRQNLRSHRTGLIAEGREYYMANCRACHGEKLEGLIGPELTDLAYGDADLYEFINTGVEGSMPSFAKIGSRKIWHIVTYLKYGSHE